MVTEAIFLVIASEVMPGQNFNSTYHSWDVLPTMEIQLEREDDKAKAGTNEDEHALREAILLSDIADEICNESRE
jgi:hypothetical protein